MDALMRLLLVVLAAAWRIAARGTHFNSAQNEQGHWIPLSPDVATKSIHIAAYVLWIAFPFFLFAVSAQVSASFAGTIGLLGLATILIDTRRPIFCALLVIAGVMCGYTAITDPLHFVAVLYGFCAIAGGAIMGEGLAWGISSSYEQQFNKWSASHVQPFSPDALTDIRSIAKLLPTAHNFDISRYTSTQHIFLALDRNKQPITVPLAHWRKTHCEFIGATGCGKSSLASTILFQCVALGDAVYVIDPKSDEWTPSVLQKICSECNVPFRYVDLTEPSPQMNLLFGITEHDLESLFVEGFDLDRKGDKYDYFRLFERMAADVTAQAPVARASIADCAGAIEPLLHAAGLDLDRTLGFIHSLRELDRISAFATREGLRLQGPLGTGGVFYIAGSLEHDATINAQKMLLLRIFQVVRARPRTASRHATVFIDDARFVAGPAATRMLATIRDRNCNLMLAHTSLADLGADRQAITDNTGIKCCFRAETPEVADYMSRLGGTIVARRRHIQTLLNSAGAELQMATNTQIETERAWIDVNSALSLPDRTCAIFGLGPARIGGSYPLQVEKSEPSITIAPQTVLTPLQLKAAASRRSYGKNAQRI